MKILKIFAIVVGIHVFALVLIFANPGCSSTSKPPPTPADTAQPVAAQPPVTVPNVNAVNTAPSSAPIMFNPDAPAVAPSSGGSVTSGLRVAPTRPNTPVANVLVTEPVADVTPATTYTVKAGDSLWSVAKKNHLTVAELTGANSLSANATLRPGQKLVIPSKASAPAAVPAAAAPTKGLAGVATKSADTTAAAAPRGSAEAVKHTVKSGETLGAIARMYGVRAADVAVANNISDPAKIKAGDQLTIPGWQTPKGTKATKSGAGGKASDKKAPPPAAEPVEATPAPATPPPVPIIRIDESPVTPAPAPKP